MTYLYNYLLVYDDDSFCRTFLRLHSVRIEKNSHGIGIYTCLKLSENPREVISSLIFSL